MLSVLVCCFYIFAVFLVHSRMHTGRTFRCRARTSHQIQKFYFVVIIFLNCEYDTLPPDPEILIMVLISSSVKVSFSAIILFFNVSTEIISPLLSATSLRHFCSVLLCIPESIFFLFNSKMIALVKNILNF